MKIKKFLFIPILIFIPLYFFQCKQPEGGSILKSVSQLINDSVVKNKLDKRDEYKLAITFQQKKLRDSAIYHYKNTLKEELDYDEKLFVNNLIGLNYYYLKKYEEAENFQKNALDSIFPLCENSNKLKIDTYTILGYIFMARQMPDSVYYYLSKIDMLLPKKLDENYLYIHRSLMGIGDIYRTSLMDYTNAEKYYNKALNIIESASEEFKEKYLLKNLYNLAITYRHKADHQRAIYYGDKVISYARSLNDSVYFEYGLSSVGNAYLELENFEEAEINIKKAIGFGTKKWMSTYFNNLSFVFFEMEQYDSAQYYCEKASYELFNDLSNLEQRSNNHESFGRIYKNIGEKELALYHYKNCLKLRKQEYGLINIKTSAIYMLLGEFYLEYGSVDSALYFFQKSLTSAIINFTDDNFLTNPVLDQISNNVSIIETLHHKADALKLKFKENRDKTLYLTSSLNTLKLCGSLIDHSWSSFSYENSKLYLERYVYQIYEKAVKTALELYKIENNEAYITDAFNFFERNKFKYLLDNLNSTIAYNKVDVNDGLMQSLKDIEYELNNYSRKRQEDPLNLLYNSIFYEIEERKRKLSDSIRIKYPDYHLIKSKETYKDLTDINNTLKNKKTALIQFFDGEEFIYAISTNGKNVSMKMIIKDSLYLESIKSIITLQAGGDTGQETLYPNFVEYTKNALFLYNILIYDQLDGPVGENVENLIIIPDGDLAKFNFEALITEMPDTSKFDYNLDYLIYDYNISYAYSSNILLTESEKEKHKNSKILAFSYGTGFENEDKFQQLKGANKEVMSISKIATGRYYYNHKASETNFKKFAGKYGIIHLALHGNADILNNEKTMLTFRSDQDDKNDGALLPEELYNLNLNPKLVVLSSCETGIGKFYKGEGVYSMARAFSYSGCQSLISTLWSIRDKYSADIMSEFYNAVSSKIPINRALRESKLQYLNNASQMSAHPRNWASFIALGKMNIIKIGPGLRYYHFIIIGIFIVIFTYIFIKKVRLFRKKQTDY